MIRVMTFLCIVSVCWNAKSAQAQASTPEALLNAYYDLWHQLERQPTAEEVESQTPYAANGFIEEWQNWENVRLALVDHLYRIALYAALQQNVETAAEYYGKCLEIDPNHPQALAAYQVDLDEAAGKRDEFTAERAGSTALSYFLTFLVSHDQGNEKAARDYFMLAQSQKSSYIASEVQKLLDTYNEAVELFNQGSYAAAKSRFEMLIELRPNQIGYDEFYRPNANSIRQYLADAIYRNETERAARFETRSRDSRFTLWYTGNWMAQFSELGLEAIRLSSTEANPTPVPVPNIKLASKSFLGGDLGASVRITDFIWVGASWSQLILTPYIEMTSDGLDSVTKISGGSISALSFFAETSKMITWTTRVYLQAGAARYSANFPNAILGGRERPPRLLSHKSASIGGFLGGGLNVWFIATDFGLLGGRLDIKYHRMKGNDMDSDRSIGLSGLRIGAGMSFAL